MCFTAIQFVMGKILVQTDDELGIVGFKIFTD